MAYFTSFTDACLCTVLVDEFLTLKDIIGAVLIISGCVIDQIPEHIFQTYLQSRTRWPGVVCNNSRIVSALQHGYNSEGYRKVELHDGKYNSSIVNTTHYNNDDDDEEKMRKNVFIN